MSLLAIETATIEVGVAVAGSGGIASVATVRPGRRHAETLHPLILEVTGRAGVALAEIEAVAVDVGPGLFTGIRVGLAAAKGLGFALGVPLVALRSTDVLLHAARLRAGAVAAVVDLRRGQLAWALYSVPADPRRPASSQALSAGSLPDPVAGTLEQLAVALASCEQPVLLAGDGARRYGESIAKAVVELGGREPELCGDELGAPPVAALATLGLERLAAGAVVPPAEAAPCYLREADVRINWTTRHDEQAPAARRDNGAAVAPVGRA
ncbi:MAG: peptidase family protein [Acidimicrobiaceae bacterium]|nr:peptidase family protein [Acidimicrobiaceae bacterium]